MLVTTIRGPMDEDLLVKRTGRDENDNEIAEWIEYWHDGELVHRSVHLTLKRWPEGMEGIGQALFGKE